MKTIKLSDVSEILSGLVINRFYTLNKGHKKYKIATLKSVEDNIIDEKNFETIYINRDIEDRYLLKKEDILFKLYPPYNVAHVAFEPKDTLVSSNFAIIRVKNKEQINPRFLTYLMNRKKFKIELKKNSEGSNVAILKINSLKELKFELKPINEQLEFSKFLDLLLKKEQLQKKIIIFNKLYMESILKKL